MAVWVATAAPAVSHAEPASTPSTSAPTLLTWDTKKEGSVALRTVDNKKKLAGAPREFRAMIKHKLRALWQGELDGLPECKQVPRVLVSALRTDGYAMGRISTEGSSTHGERCRKAVSSYVALWAIRNDGWKQVVGTADVVACAPLERVGFPSEVGVDRCMAGDQVVPYAHP